MKPKEQSEAKPFSKMIKLDENGAFTWPPEFSNDGTREALVLWPCGKSVLRT